MSRKAMPDVRTLRTATGALALVAFLALTGCTGARFGVELSSQPKPRAVDKAEGVVIRVPQDQNFNIVLPRSVKQPGLIGTADADASVRAAGEASASASVTHGGTAEGVFQLGHALSNATDRQVDFAFDVRCAWDSTASADPGVTTPDAVVGLRLYARNDRGRLLRDVALVEYTTETGVAQREATEAVSFTLTLSPGEVVSVYLAGQAHVQVPDERSASGALHVRDVQMEIKTTPAPAVPATQDAQ